MQAAVDKVGRVVLPKLVRDHLGIRPGEILDVREEGNTIVLQLASSGPHIEQCGKLLVYTGEAIGDLESAVTGHRNSRLNHLSGM